MAKSGSVPPWDQNQLLISPVVSISDPLNSTISVSVLYFLCHNEKINGDP